MGRQPGFLRVLGSTGQQIFNGAFPPAPSPTGPTASRGRGARHQAPLGISPQSDGSVKVYATWNGATRVAYWSVIGGTTRSSKSWFTTSPRTGFQTVMTLHSEPRYLKVQALDSSRHVLSTSVVAPEHSHLSIFGPDVFVPKRGGYA